MSTNIPAQLKYTKDHEWIKIEGEIAIVGITDFAQSSLGDIVFVELPEEGRELTSGETFGVVESIKSVSDLYSPVSGSVIAKNTELESSPDSCNQDPYGSWMIKIKGFQPNEIEELMSADSYQDHCASLS
jgi:glycine cleavage system H protein